MTDHDLYNRADLRPASGFALALAICAVFWSLVIAWLVC